MIDRSLLIASLLSGLVGLPAIAHEVQVSGSVGATLHVEPNDVAQAGTPTEVWFALTKAGGTVIPLEDCDCRLALYNQAETAIATPSLSPVSAEGYRNIPGATVTFPEVGAYELILSGTPQEGGQFSPFELSFEVTVAGRASSASSVPPVADDSNPAITDSSSAMDGATAPEITASPETPRQVVSSNPWNAVMLWGGAVLAIGVIGGIINALRSPGGKS